MVAIRASRSRRVVTARRKSPAVTKLTAGVLLEGLLGEDSVADASAIMGFPRQRPKSSQEAVRAVREMYTSLPLHVRYLSSLSRDIRARNLRSLSNLNSLLTLDLSDSLM